MVVRSMECRRLRARLRTINLLRDQHKPATLHWPKIAFLLSEWRGFCSKTILNMKVCGNCGFVCFGNSSDYKFAIEPLQEGLLAPYAYCNTFLLPYIHVDTMHYNICSACVKERERSRILSFMSPAYVRAILRAKPLYLQLLSLIDCRIGIVQKFNGFHSGFFRSNSLLDSPLICWNLDTLRCSNLKTIMEEVYHVFETNLLVNKLFKKYVCLLETPDPSLGVCILTSDVVSHILEWQQAKGIATHSMSLNPYDSDLHILQDVSYSVPVSRKRKHDIFDSGNLHCRDSLLLREPFVSDSNGVSLGSDDITLETTMFPFLFPHQQGHYKGDIHYSDYIRQRVHQLFSPFTLYKPFMLLSYELRQSIQLASLTRTCLLDKEYHTLKRLQPLLSEEEIFRRMIKQNVCPSIPGSPAWHSRHLKDLMCMVQAWGLPSFFLTLTCDEVSDSRWDEIRDLEAVVKSFNTNFTWKDCPVECAVLFHTRLQAFLRKYILCGDDGLLGKVQHHITRYELQGRASLHAHIPLWCSPEDVERVSNEITAYIPAHYNTDTELFDEPPPDSMESLLYKYVTTKQLHRCKDGVCIHVDADSGLRYCKLGFPCDIHLSKTPSISPKSGKWQYYRPGKEHRNVVPYHPDILILWGAHMNLQRVTNEAWSFYLLKYAMKCEPTGTLDLSLLENARALGLDNLSAVELKMISTAVLSRTVSSTEAALTCLQIPTIHRSESVTFVDSSPPDRRTSLYRKATVVCMHPVQVYGMRPFDLSGLTFYEYFRQYEVLTLMKKDTSQFWHDHQGNFVYKTNRLVRFSDFHPIYHFDQFFYNVLLNACHFRGEAQLLSRVEKGWSYLHECVNRKLVTSDEDIDNLISSYADNHLYSAVYKAEMLSNIKRHIPNDLWNVGFAGSFRNSRPLPRTILTPPPVCIDTSSLTSDQMLTFDTLKRVTAGLHMINGAPGTGKSFLISILLNWWEHSGKKVLLIATTGVAANRLHPSATTVHSAFKIPVKGALHSLHRSSEIFDLLCGSDILVIDECSMLTPHVMKCIATRLHEVMQGDDRMKNPFESKLVLLVGDMCQLPPVCHHQTENICARCHLSVWPQYSSIPKYELTTVLRQAADVQFMEFLCSIRKENPSQTLIDLCLGQCFISERDSYNFIDKDTTILCSHRVDVTKFNTFSLLSFFSIDHVVEVPIFTDAPATAEYEKWITCPKFHQLSHAAIGCKVVLTENLDISNGVVNGSTAHVDDMLFDDNGLCAIVIKLESNNRLVKVVRSVTKFKRTRECVTFRKSTFPLTLGYAMTGHKSQGCTLRNKVLVVLTTAFAAGLTYVMLSRVSKRENLRIVGSLSSADFYGFRT